MLLDDHPPFRFPSEPLPSFEDFNKNPVGKAFEAKMDVLLSKLFELELGEVITTPLNSDARASVELWQKTLEQSDSSIFPKMLDYFKGYNITEKPLYTIPSTFVHVFLKASTDFTKLDELLHKIEKYPRVLFTQQTPEAKEAFTTVEKAIESFIDISEHPETSPMFRWVGDYGAALLSLKMGEVGLERLPHHLRVLDDKLTKGYEAYNHIQEQLPALLLDTANSFPFLTERQVTSFWPEEVEILHYGVEENKADATHEALVEQLKTAKAAFDVAKERYYDVGNNALASTRLRWEVSQQYRNAGQNFASANEAVVNFRHKQHLASVISPEQIQTAVQVRKYFGTTVEQWTNLNIHNTPPRFYTNPENVNVLYHEVKRAFFFEAMFKMLQKQINTVPTEKIQQQLERGLQAIKTAIETQQTPSLLENIVEPIKIPSLSNNITITELAEKLSVLEKIYADTENSYLGLPVEVANSIEKGE